MGEGSRHEVSCSPSVIEQEFCPGSLAEWGSRCSAYLSKLFLCIRVSSSLLCCKERKKRAAQSRGEAHRAEIPISPAPDKR